MRELLRKSVNYLPASVRPWIRNMPGVAALQRVLIDRLLSSQSFVHTINAGPAAGLEFEVSLPSDKAIWAGTYESAFAAAIADEVRPHIVCYDIGGYRGYMSGVMALAGAAKVFVFEPLPVNQQALRRLCALNPKLPIELVPVAAGNTDATMGLKIMPDNSMAKLTSSAFQPESRPLSEITIDVRKIDSLVNDGVILVPNLIKVDVEGAEVEVLEGAARVLSEHRPSIFIEAHSAALDRACREKLQRLGYGIQNLGLPPRSEEEARHLMALPDEHY